MKKSLLFFLFIISISCPAAAQFLNFDSSSLPQNRTVCGYDAQWISDFGNNISPTSIPKSSYPSNAIFNCGAFDIYYEDIALSTGVDFDGVNGAARRAIVCEVYQYVQSVFNFTNIPAGDRISIEVRSNTSGSNPIGNSLAIASPIFPNSSTPGIYKGSLLNHVLTNASPNPALFDAFLQINFSYIFYSSLALPVTNCQFDLYSVLLHEVGHQLGFASLLTEPLSTLTPVSAFGNNQYTLFDWQNLWHGNINMPSSFEKMVTGTLTNPVINPLIANASRYLTDESLWLKNNGRFQNNLPVYSGIYIEPGNFTAQHFLSRSSVASHLDGEILSFTKRYSVSPGFMKPHSMQPYLDKGEVRRNYSEQELRIFLELGYQLNPVYGAGFPPNGNTNNSTVLNTNKPPYTNKIITNFTHDTQSSIFIFPDVQPADYTILNNGTPLTLDLSLDGTLQDLNGDIIRVEKNPITNEFNIFNIRGCGQNGNNHNKITVNSSGTVITFNPRANFIGRAQFGFYLHDGKERGSFMTYTIDVVKGTAFVNTPNVNTPATAPPHEELVINGDFEEGSEVRRNINLSEESINNTSYQLSRETGLYFSGVQFADAHPLHYTGYPWPTSYGIVIGNSRKDCSQGLTPITFGTFAFSFPSANSFNPIPVSGSRYSFLKGDHNYNTLSTPLQKCKRYIATFDVNFANTGLAIGSIYTFNLIVNNSVQYPINTPLQTMPVNITVGTGWQTQSVSFIYCSSTPGKFLNLAGDYSIKVFLDNVSLVEDTSPFPLSVTVNPTAPAICQGQNVTLTATAANILCSATYVWQPGNLTGASITVSPTNTTTYTVTVNDECRSASENVTVTVNPIPTITVNPSSPTILAGSSVTLTANGATTYSWAPATGLNTTTGAIVIASPQTTTTYTVTGTTNGCTFTTTVTVIVSTTPCTPASGITTQTIPQTGGTLNTGTYTNINFAVNGNLTISGDVTLAGCDMRMAAGVKINIPASARLIITNSQTDPFNNPGGRETHIYACQNMWDGIYIEDATANLFIEKTGGHIGSPALIEDAEHAVVSVAGGFFDINDAIFNKNYTGIEVKPFSNAAHNGNIVNTQFSCSVDATVFGADAFLNAPHAGQRSNSGILINEVINTASGFAGINVGSTAFNPNPTTNTFVNLDYGIWAKNSVVYAKNNLFLRCGTGISSSRGIGRGVPFAPNALFAGEENNNAAANILKNCNYGIATAGENIHLYNNNIGNTGSIAISLIATSDVNNIDVKNNDIDQAPIGLYAEFAVCTAPTNPPPPGLPNVNINRNSITDVNTGILATQIINITIGNNKVDVIPDANGYAYGIRMQNCEATVNENTVRGISGSDIKYFGIAAESCPDTKIYDNILSNVGNPLYAYGYMPNATFTCNSLQDYTYGVVMDNIPLGGVGPVGASNAASDNAWFTAPQGNGAHTYGTNGSQIQWYTQNASPFIPYINSFIGLATPLFPNSTAPASSGCNLSCANTTPPQCRSAKYNAIVSNTISYPVNPIENRYLAVEYLFTTLHADTSLMFLGSADDLLYQAFYDSVKTGNIYKFIHADEKTMEGNIVSAQNIISQIIPSNNIESASKTVRGIYLNTVAQSLPMGTADSTALLLIANTDPDTIGLSVYQARSLLGIFNDILIPIDTNLNKIQQQLSDCIGTNLVYNPSFEEITNCPNSNTQLFLAKRWSNPTNLPSAGLFNSCSTVAGIQNQTPRTGNGYGGLVVYNKFFPGTDRGFAQAYLVDTLKPNKKYCVNYYVSLWDLDTLSCNNIGMYFSQDSIQTNDSLLPLTPQVKNNLNNRLNNKTGWTQVSGLYIATGGERYIIIGNFDNVSDLDTMFISGGFVPGARYFVDDVSVVEVTNPPCEPVEAAFGYAITNYKVSFKDSSTLSASHFRWSFGDGDTSTAQKPKHTYAAPGTYTVRLIASSWCSRDTLYKTVVIIPCNNAQAAFTYAVSGNVVTFNSSTSLYATAWAWAFGNGQVSAQQNPVQSYAAPGTYTVRLIVSNACSRDTMYKTLTVTPAPPPCNNAQASFTYNANGNAVSFTGSGSLNTTAWAWAFGNGQTSNMQNPVHTYSGPGIYNVRLVASNNCSSDTLNKIVIITAPPPPPPCNNAVQAAFRFIKSGNAAAFSDSSLYATNWLWSFGDNQTSAMQNPVHAYAAPGNYTIRLIASNNCSRDTVIKTITIAPPPVAGMFKLYPNPAKGQIKMEYNFGSTQKAALQIFSATGQRLKEYPLNTILQNAVIDIGVLPGGFYTYKVVSGGVIRHRGKLVVL